MITLTLFTAAAVLIGFFGGTFWLASVVAGAIFAKLYPIVTILVVLAAIGLVALRYYWRGATMHNLSLREIREYLDSVPNETEASPDNRLCYEIVEDRAISILDSRFSEFEAGLLEEFLLSYLLLRRYEYHLVDMDCPAPVER